ncbi:hypothetical protein GQX74_011279 [Glossina fuscipes]|nr:hypothetical protein GQX74_011279 [Glossina fuscipes]
MATINRPTIQAIRSYLPTEPTIVFASFRRQTRLPAWNLITLDTYEEYSAGAVCDPGDVKYLNKLKRYIISNYEESDNNELYKYVQFVKSSVEAKRCESNLLCLHDLLNAAPELLASSLLYLLEPLNTSLKDVAEIMRIQVAQVVGILRAYGFDDRKFDAYVKECLKALSQRSLEHKHEDCSDVQTRMMAVRACRFLLSNPQFPKYFLQFSGFNTSLRILFSIIKNSEARINEEEKLLADSQDSVKLGLKRNEHRET